MSDVLEIRVPHENVNDDAVFLRVWHVADGDRVSTDQPLVEVETSKAAYEIPSPANGVLKLLVSDECEVPVGSLLGFVGETLDAIETFRATQTDAKHRRIDAPHEAKTSKTPSQRTELPAPTIRAEPATVMSSHAPNTVHSPGSTRISRKAAELIHQHGLALTEFESRGLIRARDILAFLNPATAASPPPSATGPTTSNVTAEIPAVRAAAGVPLRSESVSRVKRLEARLLTWSTQQALRSTVVTSVPIPASDLSWNRDDSEQRSVVVIREVAQLLKQHPSFNAFCSGEQNHFYGQINIGYALDAGRGLKVPVFRDADQKTQEQLLAERRRFVDEYLSDTLRPESLAGGTFTISDLSGSGILTFEPLIVEAQAAILGIGAPQPGHDGRSAFNLILSFDHRLVEGRAAARFVNELKEKLLANSATANPVSHNEAACAMCGLLASEATARKHYLVSTAGASAGRTRFICTICLSGR